MKRGDGEKDRTIMLLAILFIAIAVIAFALVSEPLSVFFNSLPPSPAFARIATSTTPSIPPPADFPVNTHIECTSDGILTYIPEYVLDKNSTYTIEFAENTSTNHPEGKWVIRMKSGENENILVRCV